MLLESVMYFREITKSFSVSPENPPLTASSTHPAVLTNFKLLTHNKTTDSCIHFSFHLISFLTCFSLMSHLRCYNSFPTGPTPSLTLPPDGKLYGNWDTHPPAHCNPGNWSGASYLQVFDKYLLSMSE